MGTPVDHLTNGDRSSHARRATAEAAVLYGASEAPSDTRVAPYGADARMLRNAAEELQDQLGDEEYARLRDAGRAMAPDDAVQFSLQALERLSQH
jgi:hypothetical protein